MKQILNQFLKERPAVTIKGIADEVGVSRQSLDYIRNGRHEPRPELNQKLMETFKKYGWLGYMECEHSDIALVTTNFKENELIYPSEHHIECIHCGQKLNIHTVTHEERTVEL